MLIDRLNEIVKETLDDVKYGKEPAYDPLNIKPGYYQIPSYEGRLNHPQDFKKTSAVSLVFEIIPEFIKEKFPNTQWHVDTAGLDGNPFYFRDLGGEGARAVSTLKFVWTGKGEVRGELKDSDEFKDDFQSRVIKPDGLSLEGKGSFFKKKQSFKKRRSLSLKEPIHECVMHFPHCAHRNLTLTERLMESGRFAYGGNMGIGEIDGGRENELPLIPFGYYLDPSLNLGHSVPLLATLRSGPTTKLSLKSHQFWVSRGLNLNLDHTSCTIDSMSYRLIENPYQNHQAISIAQHIKRQGIQVHYKGSSYQSFAVKHLGGNQIQIMFH